MDTFTELFGTSPLIWAILGAEAAFWILLFGGLAVRYLLRNRRLSTIMLIGVPVVDLLLLTFTAVDLAGGVEPNFSHLIATIYLGFTIAFGHSLITKTDAWFAHRFADGPAPAKKPKSGPAYVRAAWLEWRRVALAVGIAVVGLLAMQVMVGWAVPSSFAEANEDVIWSMALRLLLIAGIWLVAGPVYATVFKSTPATDTTQRVSPASDTLSNHR
ncbi:hypothetical protein KXS11_13050 [Plantibacter flavus]|uniref:hypothetical protein n=1 Tax=Plantibacter flavus TaxID=150123 RepID=UPI003F152CB0